MLYTPLDLIGEVLVVDDGSTLEYLVTDAKVLVNKVPRARLIRNEDQLGEGRLRNEMARFAQYPTVVFLSPTVVCSPGWLEPLIELLRDEPLTLALPHLDNVNDPVTYDYVKTPDELVVTMTWSLGLRVVKSHGAPVKDRLASPASRGEVFAVTREFIRKFGLFDEVFNDLGAENLELSLRTWLCGGMVKVAQCSHVGILRLNDPLRAHSSDSVRRIVSLWLPSEKELVFKLAKISDEKSAASLQVASPSNRLQCKNFDWFLDEMKNLGILNKQSPKANQVGMLKVKTGMCARVGKDSRIDLGSCSTGTYELLPTNMEFELLSDGRITIGDQCLTTQNTAYVVAEKCATTENNHQRFNYDSKQRLVNDWSSFCLMHVTDPEKQADNNPRQIAMAQKCEADSDGKFSTWEFISV